jgi:hypothetical protein
VSVFFENIINSNPHIDTVHEFLGHVTEEEIVDASFQDYRAMCHTARATVRKMSVWFGDVIISKGLWPIQSLNLSPLYYFVRATLKIIGTRGSVVG